MGCDVIVQKEESGTISCSVLGQTVGAFWALGEPGTKSTHLSPGNCDAQIIRKKGLFGTKAFFQCHIMKKFRVDKGLDELEAKISSQKEKNLD